MKSRSQKILLGVTASESLKLMNGLPEFLASKGWEVIVVACWEGSEIPISTPAIKFVNIKMTRSPSPILDLYALVRWLFVLHKESPQVVFCGTPKAGMLGIVAGWLSRTPARIYHLRGLRLETSSGLSRQLFRLIERMVIYLSSVTLCVSPSLKEAVISEKLGPEDKLVVLGKGSSNGIEISEFGNLNYWSSEALEFSQKFGLDPNLPTIGFVGRLTADKGIFDLISAHKILIANRIPNQLLLVGKTENRKEADRISHLIQRNPKIIKPGLMLQPQIAFSLMTIFCLPSYREGFPNVVLEAGLSKLPTVTTTATGARDSVIPKKTGLIYRTGDLDDLVSALTTLIQDPSLAKKYGKNAYEFVAKEFDRLMIWEIIETFLRNTITPEQERNL